jgi:hypothetical protein
VAHEENAESGADSEQKQSVFPLRVLEVEEFDSLWIVEHGTSFVKGNAVLPQVLSIFRRIPLEPNLIHNYTVISTRQVVKMDKQIPLISTRSKGPLGFAHLPRLWLKMRLAARGQLADGYRSGEGGFDGLLLEALGIELKDAATFIADSQPSYLAFEKWVQEKARPESLTPEAIAAVNERILTFPKPEPGRSEMVDLLGLPKDDSVWFGTDLNDLDDWQGFHTAMLDDR